MSRTVSVLKEAGTRALREQLVSSPVFGGVRVAHLLLVFCVVFLFCLSSFCVCMLLVSLNDPLKFINDFYKAKPA
jgi:hypothetical protein